MSDTSVHQPQTALPKGVTLSAPVRPQYAAVLSAEALAFVADLARTFRPRVKELLAKRRDRQARLDAGERPDFLPETADVRARDWKVSPLPKDLLDRRVEITGPDDRKMVINALNSGASVFMADFEDANSPTWDNLVDGQINLGDAVRRTITFTAPETGKKYALKDEDRGAARASARLAPRRAAHARRRRAGPRRALRLRPLLLPQREGARSRAARARTSTCPRWRATSRRASGTTCSCARRRSSASRAARSRRRASSRRCPAAFEMDEILYELREHSAGLNCGRWDYIFSFIKKRAERPGGRPAGSRAGHDGQGLPRAPTSSSSSRRATAAASTRWAGWRRRSRSRTTPRPTRRRSRRCAPTSSAR